MGDEDEVVAAELALGLLDDDARRAAERRREQDDAFADAVARWEAHAAMLVDAPEDTPRPSLWTQIEARLPANDVGAASPAPAHRRWQVATLAASGIAAALALAVVERPAPRAPPVVAAPAPLVAMLSGETGSAALAVSFEPASRRLVLTPRALDTGGRAAELWVIPADRRPRSLGVVSSVPSAHAAPAPAASALAPGATLAISIEPAGGSPTGQPTGPVILTGTLAEI